MSPHDSGVTELLRRASDDLAPDVDRLVSGGITRGRTRQRRARIGTTVASLAVIGVVGVLAAVVPRARLMPTAPVTPASRPSATSAAETTEPARGPRSADRRRATRWPDPSCRWTA